MKYNDIAQEAAILAGKLKNPDNNSAKKIVGKIKKKKRGKNLRKHLNWAENSGKIT